MLSHWLYLQWAYQQLQVSSNLPFQICWGVSSQRPSSCLYVAPEMGIVKTIQMKQNKSGKRIDQKLMTPYFPRYLTNWTSPKAPLPITLTFSKSSAFIRYSFNSSVGRSSNKENLNNIVNCYQFTGFEIHYLLAWLAFLPANVGIF